MKADKLPLLFVLIHSVSATPVYSNPVPTRGTVTDLLGSVTESLSDTVGGVIGSVVGDASLLPYSIPRKNDDIRLAGVATKQATFEYGPGTGGGPSSPSGILGAAYVQSDTVLTTKELATEIVLTLTDKTTASIDLENKELKTLDDYVRLYDDNWQITSAPAGIAPGLLTNYTQDLLFSMERLSFNPFAVYRLDPGFHDLPFTIDNDLSVEISGLSTEDLFRSGRLFHVDHRAQKQLQRSDKYAAACDALFFLSASPTSQFLPLAIRTNVGVNFIYTPRDEPDDWLLAKIMFNVNDFFMGQFHHLAYTHYVAEAAYQPAIRVLSDTHPVLAILSRLMYGAFGIRPLAALYLFPPGGVLDKYFGFTGAAAQQFASALYTNSSAGAFQSNYFRSNLRQRGLLESKNGPELPKFPFYEDAGPIVDAIHEFMNTFVNSYYPADAAVRDDPELQAWVEECNGPGKVIDFPTSLSTRDDLIAVLTHVGYLVSSAHHAVNLNQLLTASAVLPFHPTALYKPIPTMKGVSNVASFLPPFHQCLGLLEVAANFGRPLLANSPRTLLNMFNDPTMLLRTNNAVRKANEEFMASMRTHSEIFRLRNFDTDGLSQGMPFVWRALDPSVVPWSLSI